MIHIKHYIEIFQMGFSAMINATDKKNITCRVQEVREDILLWAEGGKKQEEEEEEMIKIIVFGELSLM
jgi:hypothetical protein